MTPINSHDDGMQLALAEADKARLENEVPIGAVIICDNQIVASAHNTCEADKNPLQHAEIKVLSLAAKNLGRWRLNDCTLYVTLEPCPMCLGALFQARIDKLVFGCADSKRTMAPNGKNSSQSFIPGLIGKAELIDNNHRLEITAGIKAKECSQILKDFFRQKRGQVPSH